MKFLRNVLATIVALILFSVISVIILIGIISSASKEKVVELKPNTVLHIDLSRPIVEIAPDDPFSDLEFFPGNEEVIGLKKLKECIANAANDDNIKAIYLESGIVMTGSAIQKEIREALLQFKESGKEIISYSEIFSESGLLMSSVANKLYMAPEGYIEFNGLSSQIAFFKNTFDKLGVEPIIFRVGDYKSAVEPLIREEMSDENEKQLTQLLESVYSVYINDLSGNLGLDKNKLRNISDSMLVQNANQALKYGLVTNVGYKDDVLTYLQEITGASAINKINSVSINDYRKTFNTFKSSSNKIAIVVAEGEILSGNESEDIQSERFAKIIRKIRLDDKYKALVLRVNSPGGSALASDIIWRELMLTKKVKPVITSMSNMATSGGYYIAAASDTILAQPNTITGSIGVYGMLFNAKEFFNDKLGVTFDGVKTGQYSDFYSITKPMTEAEKMKIQKEVENAYQTFINKVAEGRNLSEDSIKSLASGRVYTGEDALKIGLVDLMGNLENAVEIAAKKAGIEDDYKTIYMPEPKNFLEKIMEDSENKVQAHFINKEMGIFAPYFRELNRISKQTGVQARLPFTLEIQ